MSKIAEVLTRLDGVPGRVTGCPHINHNGGRPRGSGVIFRRVASGSSYSSLNNTFFESCPEHVERWRGDNTPGSYLRYEVYDEGPNE